MNVSDIVQDVHFRLAMAGKGVDLLETSILAAMNRGLDNALRVAFVPDLIIKDQVIFDNLENFDETDDEALIIYTADLPDDYHHDLFNAYNVTGQQDVDIRTGTKALYKEYAACRTGGYIADIAVQGSLIYGLPTYSEDAEDILDIWYYSAPAALTIDGTTPTYIPDAIVHPLLLNYALAEKLGDLDARALHEAAVETLKLHYPNAPKLRPVITRTARFF